MSFDKMLEKYSELETWQKVVIAGIGAPIGLAAGICAAPAVGAALSGAGIGILGGWLSGAAASSAGLAALGGGAVITGGLGVAGGTAVVATAATVTATAAAAAASHVANQMGSKSKDENDKARKKNLDPKDIKFT